MVRHFDLIYAVLNVTILVCLAAAVLTGIVATARHTGRERLHGEGVLLCAAGMALALLGGLFADALLKSSVAFQQVRFGLYYAGFALIAAGTMRLVRSAAGPHPGALAHWSGAVVTVVYCSAVAVSLVFLLVPATFVLNRYAEQVQLPIYWLPLLATSAVCAVVLFVQWRSTGPEHRWLLEAALFASFILLGLLRESELLADLGDPLANLLVSFVPFLLAAVFLLRAGLTRVAPHPLTGHRSTGHRFAA